MPDPLNQHRYLAALPRGDNSVSLSWRLLPSDVPEDAFQIDRSLDNASWERVNTTPVTDSTCFLDHVPQGGTVSYRVVNPDDVASESVTVDVSAPASSVILETPLSPEDTTQGLVVGDLNNNARMGYVVRVGRNGTVWFTAFSHEGKPLWEFDTRLPEHGGWDGSMNHVPFLCWDLNDDGRTEFATHAFKGTYPAKDYSTAVAGETFTVLDAETGKPAWEVPWPAKQSRVMMTLGHLNGIGKHASVVVLDETYGDVVLTALDGLTGRTAWRVDQGRGAGHNLDIADIDDDGVQEVICGGICYNGDGSIRWEAEPFGHTDISKPAKFRPDLPGLQIWYAVEKENTGVYLLDKDGQTLWKEPFKHAHYGWVARHAPGVPGLHPHTAEDGRREEQEHFPIFLPDGSHWLNLTDWQRKNFVPVHWDEQQEVVFIIRKENKRVVRLLENGDIENLPEGQLPEGGHYGRNLACVDVVGDFRENIVTIDEERHSLIVLGNPTPATRRTYSPCYEFDYLHDRSQLGSGYYIYLSPPEGRV